MFKDLWIVIISDNKNQNTLEYVLKGKNLACDFMYDVQKVIDRNSVEVKIKKVGFIKSLHIPKFRVFTSKPDYMGKCYIDNGNKSFYVILAYPLKK